MELPKEHENIDDLVDHLLRDNDFLLAKELKHKADELNQLLMQAQSQDLKVELTSSQVEVRPGKIIPWLDVKIFKEL